MIRRDHHGLGRWFYHETSGRQAPTLRRLFADPEVPCRLDAAGARGHVGLGPCDAETTCFAGVRAVRPGHMLRRADGRWVQESFPLPAPSGEFLDILAPVVDEALQPGTALALGGGLDSALLLAVVRRVLGRAVPVFSLAPRISGYSEREAVVSTARALGVEPVLFEVGEHDFLAALSDCVSFAEVPLYNLHPVSKWLFARQLQEAGVRRVITGDGADQVFAGVPGWDYLPIVGALFEAAEIDLCCPFLHPRVAGWGAPRADPAKSALRELGSRLLPASVAAAPKVVQMAPEMDLSGVAEPRHLDPASRVLGLPLGGAGKPDVRVVTLALLLRHFPRLLG